MKSILSALKERAIPIKLARQKLKYLEEKPSYDDTIVVIGPSDHGFFISMNGMPSKNDEIINALLIREADLSSGVKQILFHNVNEVYTDSQIALHRLYITSLILEQYPKKRDANKILQDYLCVSSRYIRCYSNVAAKASPDIYRLTALGKIEIKQAASIANLDLPIQEEIAKKIQKGYDSNIYKEYC